MPLASPYDPDNIFARILRGEVPAARVWEDEHVLAFMDAFPQSEGHVLVISKTSTASTLLEVEPETLARLAAATRRTARAVVSALDPDGFLIVQLNGAASGQSVFHLHFHVIPRREGVTLRPHSGKMEDGAVLASNAAKIREAL